MNAPANARAHALAHDPSAGSADAKRREGTAPHNTAPNGVPSGWSPFHHTVQLGDVALRIGMVTISKFIETGHAERQVRDGMTACWEFSGYKDPAGYGRVRGVGAHRRALMVVGVEIPEGHHVLHACDNPPCINPDHLAPGTRSQNMRDMVAKGRHRYPAGGQHHAAKLSDAQVVEMRDGYTGARGEITRLAVEYGLTAQQVSQILRGKSRASSGGKIHPAMWRRGGWPA
jgi:hypothetical protein